MLSYLSLHSDNKIQNYYCYRFCVNQQASLVTIENSKHLQDINELISYQPNSYVFNETYFTGLYVNPLNLYRTTGDGR